MNISDIHTQMLYMTYIAIVRYRRFRYSYRRFRTICLEGNHNFFLFNYYWSPKFPLKWIFAGKGEVRLTFYILEVPKKSLSIICLDIRHKVESRKPKAFQYVIWDSVCYLIATFIGTITDIKEKKMLFAKLIQTIITQLKNKIGHFVVFESFEKI